MLADRQLAVSHAQQCLVKRVLHFAMRAIRFAITDGCRVEAIG